MGARLAFDGNALRLAGSAPPPNNRSAKVSICGLSSAKRSSTLHPPDVLPLIGCSGLLGGTPKNYPPPPHSR